MTCTVNNSPNHLVELDGSTGIFNGVVGFLLDVLLQQIGSKEAQAELALPLEMEKKYGVNDLHHMLSHSQTMRLAPATGSSNVHIQHAS